MEGKPAEEHEKGNADAKGGLVQPSDEVKSDLWNCMSWVIRTNLLLLFDRDDVLHSVASLHSVRNSRVQCNRVEVSTSVTVLYGMADQFFRFISFCAFYNVF